MKEINLARIIISKRKEKGITQDDLANYIGVSKASVSKWETGQSYPDIVFLPQLAAYFNISLDELMGYEPQMTKEDICTLYHKLSADFTEKPFDEVIGDCQKITKKYFSCFQLLLQICVLYLNHFQLASTQGAQHQILSDTRNLCERIKCESQDLSLCRQANFMSAMCEVYLGNPKMSIELMKDANDTILGEEVILANAYYLAGDVNKAREAAQVGIFRHLLGILGDMPIHLLLHTNEKSSYEEIVAKAVGLCELFNIRQVHPALLAEIYVSAAQGYSVIGEDEKALKMLHVYAETAVKTEPAIIADKDPFFDKIDGWLEKLELGLKPPRDEQTIRQSFLDKVIKNPAFDNLKKYKEYQLIVDKIQLFKKTR